MPLLDEDYLILSTIHSAKGQEWTSVFVLNIVDGCIPSDLGTGTTPEIEEERRLLYVAMTRAKDQLHLMVPQRFFTHGQRSLGDRHVYAQRTRFIPNGHHDALPEPLLAAAQGDRPRRAQPRRAGRHESQDAEHVGLMLGEGAARLPRCEPSTSGRQSRLCRLD